MERLFQINKPAAEGSLHPVLSIRIGTKHCCFSITEFASGDLRQLAYYTAEEINEPFLTELFTIHPELNAPFYQVLVCYDHIESSLVPEKHFKEEDGRLLLKSLYGVNADMTVLIDAVGQHQLYNVFAVPKELHERMVRKFAFGKYLHQYTLVMKYIDAVTMGGSLWVELRNDDFTVVVMKGNDFKLANVYSYAVPEDILYYLLKICATFGLSQQEVLVELSGLIDRQSALYKEMNQYFLHIILREATWPAPSEDTPAHFFTSLNDLSRCAS